MRKAPGFGFLGLCQLWKQLRDAPVRFPPYVDGIETGEIYRDLGRLQFHRRLQLGGDALSTQVETAVAPR